MPDTTPNSSTLDKILAGVTAAEGLGVTYAPIALVIATSVRALLNQIHQNAIDAGEPTEHIVHAKTQVDAVITRQADFEARYADQLNGTAPAPTDE